MKRKAQRRDFKIIEGVLHPPLKINGFDILHEHKGRWIIFSAWKDNSQHGSPYWTFEIDRTDILETGYNREEFYESYGSELENLTMTPEEFLQSL